MMKRGLMAAAGLCAWGAETARAQSDVFPVHPLYEVVRLRHEDFKVKVGGMDWLPDGRLAVAHWGVDIEDGDPGYRTRSGKVFVLSKVESENPALIERLQIGDSLWQPLGVKVVGNKIYVIEKEKISVFTDNGTPGKFRKLVNETLKGWDFNSIWGQWSLGLEYKDGSFYTHLTIGWKGGPPSPDATAGRGSIVRIGLDGRTEVIASGLRSSNALGFGPEGELYVGENNGEWVPTEYIAPVRRGANYGHLVPGSTFTWSNGPYQPPAVHIPHKEMGASPSGILTLPKGPYAGHMLISDQNWGQIIRCFLEKVNGEYQGAIFRFSGGFEAGPNRILLGRNGEDIYVGGLGGTAPTSTCGNWCWHEKFYGLDKLKRKAGAAPPFEMLAMRSRSGGVELEFTKPLAPASLAPSLVKLEQYAYVPNATYGGGQKTMREALTPGTWQFSPDNRRLYLPLPAMKAKRVVHVTLEKAFRSAAGDTLLDGHAYYTLNAISASKPFDINGCRDSRYQEFNPAATFDDGTCRTLSTGLAAGRIRPGELSVSRDPAGNVVVRGLGEAPFRAFLSDLRGRTLAAQAGSRGAPVAFPGGNLRPGIYLLKVEGDGFLPKVEKIAVP